MMTATAAAVAFLTKSTFPAAAEEVRIFPTTAGRGGRRISWGGHRGRWSAAGAALEKGNGKKGDAGASGVPNSNYVVPLDMALTSLTRPLAEILRDLNKRVPDKIINPDDNTIPWYHVNRMLSFYAPGWCGEVRDVIFSDNGNVTVVYRVTIRGSDGEAHRESTGTVPSNDGGRQSEDPVAAAEEIAFCRACARFGFGLYLYHQDSESSL